MEKEKKGKIASILANALLYLGVFVLTLGALWGLLWAVCQIPNEKLRANMEKSVEYFLERDAFERTKGEQLAYIRDNYADVILMNVCWYMGVDNHKAPVLNTMYYYDDETPNAQFSGKQHRDSTGFATAVASSPEPNKDYSRYWHGSAVFIRPLLLITDVAGIKNIMFGFILFLMGISLLLLVKRKQFFACAALILSALAVQIWGIRLALEYLPGFLALFLILPFFILLEKRGTRTLVTLSVISGTILTFFDFLTVETITILVPLMVVFLVRQQEGRLGDLRSNLWLSAKCGIAWGLAYLGTFVAKWGLASIFSGENKFKLAIESAEYRTAGSAEGLDHFWQIIYAPNANLSTMFLGVDRLSRGNIVLGIVATIFVLTTVIYLLRGKVFHKDFTILMLLLSAVVYVRYLVLNNHSYLHEYFTFRAQMSVVFALLAISWVHLDFSILRKKKRS